ncbi:hypothetical protein D9M68_677240 [compost metagenome]
MLIWPITGWKFRNATAAPSPGPGPKNNAARTRSTRWGMKRKGNWKWLGPMLLGLAMLCSGCSGASTKPSEGVAPAAIPSLPSSARQPKPVPECEPTCSAGLERLLDSMLPRPTSGE